MYKNALKEDLIRVVEDLDGETYIQFAARLTANFQYYCSLRKVNSFESLCDLIISDKLFETLNKETATHIGIREAEDWFRPIDLAKEFSSGLAEKGKKGRTAADSVQSEWPLWHAAKSNLCAQAQLTKTRTETFELVKVEPKL
ncbi:uncharacterized protein TNCV_1743931 [Trichonephila clavipes]|nr:uncharacterized protein TNCV_1743931 [Trichonephila clavipes]